MNLEIDLNYIVETDHSLYKHLAFYFNLKF
ncbi:protein of unknown function [Ruminococcaceae bacterium BL-6]|nr:protein of unknown function [Ruminococcaceae bacterium BL-6]